MSSAEALRKAVSDRIDNDECQLPEVSGNITPRPGLIHRLDKDTSGLIVVGKNEYALQFLAKKFFDLDKSNAYRPHTYSLLVLR